MAATGKAYASLTKAEAWAYLKEVPRKFVNLRLLLVWHINPVNGWTRRAEPAGYRLLAHRYRGAHKREYKEAAELATSLPIRYRTRQFPGYWIKSGTIKLGKVTLKATLPGEHSDWEYTFSWRVPLKK